MRKLAILLLLCSFLPALLSAQGTLTVDTYIDMNTSSPGTTVTTTIMANGTQGTFTAPWVLTPSTPTGLAVGTHQSICTPNNTISVRGGSTFAPGHTTNSLSLDDAHSFTYAQINFPAGHRQVSTAGCILLGAPNDGGSSSLYDLVYLSDVSGHYAVMQLNNGSCGGGSVYGLAIETAPGGVTTHSPCITVVPGKTYYYNLWVDYTGGTDKLAIYDTTAFKLVGQVSSTNGTGADLSFMTLGNREAGTDSGTTTFFENMIVDFTTALFPLGPGGPNLWSNIIAGSRAINWSTAGVTGGIPTTRTPAGPTIPAGASAATIQAAMNACGANQFVQLAAGTYNLTTGLTFTSHNNCTLRGAGPDQTFLVFSGTVSCGGEPALLCAQSSDGNYWGNPTNTATWTGAAAGATSITLSSVTNLHVGSPLVLDQVDDASGSQTISNDTGNIFTCDAGGTTFSNSCSDESGPNTESGTQRGQGTNAVRDQQQLVTVTGIAGNVVTFTPGLYMPNWRSARSPGAWWATSPVSGAGFENLSIDGTSTSTFHNTMFFNAVNSWMSGIRSINPGRSHVGLWMSPRITIQNSYFYGNTHVGTECDGNQPCYGIETDSTSDSLFLNNIFQTISAMMMNNSSSSGTVWAYNFGINNYYCCTVNDNNWAQQSSNLHSVVDNILYEGNVSDGIYMDRFHGDAHFITVFRNAFNGRPFNNGSLATVHTNPLIVYPYSRYVNLIGNVLGTASYHTNYASLIGTAQATQENSIYLFFSSQENCCNSGSVGTFADTLTGNSLMRWGNWDTATSSNPGGTNDATGTRFVSGEVPSNFNDTTTPSLYINPLPASQTLPASFIFSAKPIWWPAAKPWPPIGPDVSNGNISNTGGHANTNPAADCYLTSMHGPANGSGSVLTFTPSTCYSIIPPALVAPVFTPIPGGYVPTVSNPQTTGLPNFPYGSPNPVNPVVTIMDNSPGATLCVTTDGSTPAATTAGTCSNGTPFTPGTYPTATAFQQYRVPSSPIAAIPVTITTTIKAIATQVGFTNSTVATGLYTIDASCVQPTITFPTGGQPVTVTTGLDGTGGIGNTDGLAWVQLSYTTSVPTDAQGEIGGGSPQTPYQISAYNGTASTSHVITFTGLLPGVPLIQGGSATNQNWQYGVTSHTIGTGGLVCGSASQVSFNPEYNGGLNGHLSGTAPPTSVSGAMSAYKLHIRGSQHVTAGYSAYIAVDEYNISGGNPASGQFVLALTFTGGPPGPAAGMKFNWMGANNKTTSAGCSNTAIDLSSQGDALTQSTGGICNDTNTQGGTWGTREIQFVTTATGPNATTPGTYTLNIAAHCIALSTTCTAPATTAGQYTWQIVVDAPSAPFGISLAKSAPASFPAIPNQATYLSAINTFGKNFWICAQDANGSDTIRPNDVSQLLSASNAGTFGSWFYDGVNAWFAADSLRLNWGADGPNGLQQNWSQCREDVAEMYRDKNALAGPQQQYFMFTQGYYQDYVNGGGLHGQALDKMQITQMTTVPQSPFSSTNASYLGVDYRDVGYSFRNYVHAVAMGLDAGIPISAMSGTGTTGPFTLTITSSLFSTTPPTFWNTNRAQPIVLSGFPAGTLATAYNKSFGANSYNGTSITVIGLGASLPACSSGSCGSAVAYIAPSSTWNLNPDGTAAASPMRAWMGYVEDHIISSLETECIQQDPQYVYQQFMSSVSMRELVEYYNLITPDPRIPNIIKACADYLYANFQPGNVGAWRYTTESNFTQANITGGGPCTVGTTSCVPMQGSCVAIEDQMIPPIFAWLYQYSGQTIYQQEGDLMFGLGATFTTGNGTATGQNQLPGGCYGTSSMSGVYGHGSGSIGKQFSQAYMWGPYLNYVAQRNPQFNIFPGSIGVYDQTQNTTSTPQIVTISNPLNPGVATSQTIGTATITGTNAANFSLGTTASACNGALAPGAAPCTGIQVTFSPAAVLTAITAYNATLNIPVGSSTYKIPLYGTGVIGTLAPVTFSPVPGTYAGNQNVTLSSPNATNICYQTAVNKLVASGNGVINVPGVINGGGGTCTDGQSTQVANNSIVPVSATTTFISTAATAPGWADSVPTNPQSTFTITNAPTATLSPNLNFGGQNINTTSAPLFATLTNTGTVNVIVTQAQLFGTNFTLTASGTCAGTSFTLAPGASCTFGITFSPTATIAYVGGCPTNNCFSVTDNASGSPQTISLSGQGTQATITWSSPQGGTAYTFGNVNVGIPINSAPLTLQNTGTGPLNVSVAVTGANQAQFIITSTTCPGILAAGSSCTYTVTFTPAAVASYSAALTETDSLSSNSPQNLTLSGNGVTPAPQQVAPAPWVIIARRKGR